MKAAIKKIICLTGAETLYKIFQGAIVGLIGNPVKIRSGPAAVTGDEICNLPLSGFNRMGRCGN
jgi:hypothetical protein